MPDPSAWKVLARDINFPIVLEGAHSVGKSTLGRQIADLLGCEFVPEIARDVLRRHGTTAAYEGKTPLEIARCQEDIMVEKARIVEGYAHQRRLAVIDRGVPSVYAYSLLHLDRYQYPQSFLRCVEHEVERHSRINAFYLLLEPSIPLESDGVRETPPARRESVHLLIQGMLYRYGYYFNTIRQSDPELRIVEVFAGIHQATDAWSYKEWLSA